MDRSWLICSNCLSIILWNFEEHYTENLRKTQIFTIVCITLLKLCPILSWSSISSSYCSIGLLVSLLQASHCVQKSQYIHKANHRRCSTIRFTGSIDRTNDNHLYLCSMPSTLIAQLFTCCLSKIPWSMTAAGIARTFSSNYLSFLPLHLCHLFICPSALPYYMNAKISKQRTRRWENSIREIIQINFEFIVPLIKYHKTIIMSCSLIVFLGLGMANMSSIWPLFISEVCREQFQHRYHANSWGERKNGEGVINFV